MQVANYPANPNLAGTAYTLTDLAESERAEWHSSADPNFREIIGSLLYSGTRPSERRPKQLKSNSSSDEFYTEDFLWCVVWACVGVGVRSFQ